MRYSLNMLYEAVGIRKQSFHEWMENQIKIKNLYAQMIPLIEQIRKEHPRMSSRVMYHLLQPDGIGRDKFIRFSTDHGYGVPIKRNYSRTTDSSGVVRFPNLIKLIKVHRSHQVWVSDITYYHMNGRFYYITLIMDLWSRYITGYHGSKDLRTISTTLPALKNALKMYCPTKTLILHSDGGGQYYCKEFRELTAKNNIRNSMTRDVGENNHAERLNGTIKNDYLSCYMPTSFKEFQQQLKRAVYNYNNTKPHHSLQMETPAERLCLSTKNSVFNKEKKKQKKKEQQYQYEY